MDNVNKFKQIIPNSEGFEEVYIHADPVQAYFFELFLTSNIKSIFIPGDYTELLDFIDGNGFKVEYDYNRGIYTVSRLT